MNNRIFELIEKNNLTQSDFASKTGISPSALTQLKNKEGNLSIDNILKIKKNFPKLSLDWLILGEGSMYEEISNSQEPTLFSNKEINPINRDNYITEIKENNTQSFLSDNFSTSNKIENVEPATVVEKIVVEKKITKIIVFYDDNKFEEISKE